MRIMMMMREDPLAPPTCDLEFSSLMGISGDHNGQDMEQGLMSDNTRPNKKFATVCGKIFWFCLGGALVALMVLQAGVVIVHKNGISWPPPSSGVHGKERPPTSTLQCPAHQAESAENDSDETFERFYGRNNARILRNLTHYWDTFRNESFDFWGETYNDFKQILYQWKVDHLVPHLYNGAHIFESACGIGLNMYLTMEIARELRPDLHDITVSGNEYLPSSAQVANVIWNASSPFTASMPTATSGSICAADSGNLSYIPDNTFDLVFTGYISPLSDPLKLNKTLVEVYNMMKELCNCAADDWQCQTLHHLMQQQQQDWYGQWVGEMFRIAKAGSAVLVENVALEYCEALQDWGGVPRSYWSLATAERYHWDIDTSNIQIVSLDGPNFINRYHVAMTKLGPKVDLGG